MFTPFPAPLAELILSHGNAPAGEERVARPWLKSQFSGHGRATVGNPSPAEGDPFPKQVAKNQHGRDENGDQDPSGSLDFTAM